MIVFQQLQQRLFLLSSKSSHAKKQFKSNINHNHQNNYDSNSSIQKQVTYFLQHQKRSLSTSKWPHQELYKESHFLESDDGKHKLHLLQIVRKDLFTIGKSDELPACLLLHGAVENSKIFYSDKGQGLAPYLARKGANVFVADLRGRGQSTPLLKIEKANARHGQTEAIRESIPTFAQAVENLSGAKTQTWISHSWGGILFASAMAWDPSLAKKVDSQVHFGAKKDISEGTNSMEYFLKIGLGWSILCPILARIYGYLPAKDFKIGSDDESISSLRDSISWVLGYEWKDGTDKFDYQEAYLSKIPIEEVPPTYNITASHDKVLGNPKDVARFAERTHQTHKFIELSKKNGNKENYNHNTMLTSRNATQDHFPSVIEWINKHAST